MVKCSDRQWILSCDRRCLPQVTSTRLCLQVTEVLTMLCAQMENLLYFITKEKASDPIRGSLQSHHHVCISLGSPWSASPFLCISTVQPMVSKNNVVHGRESSTVLCPKLERNSAQLLVPAPYRQPPSLKKGEAAKGWVPCIWVCISLPRTQMSDQQIPQGDGHFRVPVSTKRIKWVKNLCGNKGLSGLFSSLLPNSRN